MLWEHSDSESKLASDKMSTMGWLRGLGNVLRRGGHSEFKVMEKDLILFTHTANKDNEQSTVDARVLGEKETNHT